MKRPSLQLQLRLTISEFQQIRFTFLSNDTPFVITNERILYSSLFKITMKVIKTIVLVLVLLQIASSDEQPNCRRLNYLPMPKHVTCGKENITLDDPCKLLFHVKVDETGNDHISEVIGFQMKKTFHCNIPNVVLSRSLNVDLVGFAYKIEIEVSEPELKSVFTTKAESYLLKIAKTSAGLRADTYVGMLRGLQTFFQTIHCPRYRNKMCEFKSLPLDITDEPAFVYRGLMIDSSRHFLPTKLIFETIDAMMYNKMNVLHWHIVDEDSFPLILDSHPEIAKYASYSPDETYTTKDARQIVEYAKRRGVRVVPELDTPGHAASWGLAPENKDVACTFGTGFMGPLDVTLDKTYKLVKEVFAEIFDIFPDPIVHLGGDEVVLTCLTNKTEFLQKEGIKQMEIERHYRRKQHKMLVALNPKKTFMYWMNTNDIAIEDGDIVHWWGGGMPATKNPVVISQYGPFYLDMGVGNYLGVSYGNYQTWLDLYNQDIGRMIDNYSNRQNVLGAEVCLWSELSNQYIHHMKIWIRTSAFAERTWTVAEFNPKPDVLGRIANHERLMNRRGIPTSGATSQQCETSPEFC